MFAKVTKIIGFILMSYFSYMLYGPKLIPYDWSTVLY